MPGENVRLAAQSAGICGRTSQVVELGLLPNVDACALVTDTDLETLTGRLNLRGSQIFELGRGAFASVSRGSTENAVTLLDVVDHKIDCGDALSVFRQPLDSPGLAQVIALYPLR